MNAIVNQDKKKTAAYRQLAGWLVIGAFVLITTVGALYFFYVRQLDPIELYRRHHQEIQFVQKLSNVIFFPWLFTPARLTRYDLLIDADNLLFLNANLPPRYAGALLGEENRQDIPAQLFVNGKEFTVTVRYRGDTDVHWRDPKKSWRINFNQGETLDGSESINLVIPVDRHYLIEELSFYRARKLGLAVPETKFVNLFINGERQGVYWQFAQWGKSFLAHNSIAAETDLYGSIEFADLLPGQAAGFASADGWRKYVSGPGGPTDTTNLATLLEVINAESAETFNQQIAPLVDLDNFLAWQINQYLMTSDHQSGINLRFYFDPAVGKFKFIPWDISMAELPPPLFEVKYNELITRVLKNPVFLHDRNLRLWRYVGNHDNLTDDLAFYDQLDQLTKGDFYKDSLKVESHLAYREKIKTLRQGIIDRFELLKQNLNDANAAIAISLSPDRRLLTLDLSTSGFSAIALTDITIDNQSCAAGLTIYRDANNNGRFDAADTRLDQLSCQNGIYQSSLAEILYSVKQETELFLEPGENHAQFFITASSPFNSGVTVEDNISFIIINAVTDQSVSPTVTTL